MLIPAFFLASFGLSGVQDDSLCHTLFNPDFASLNHDNVIAMNFRQKLDFTSTYKSQGFQIMALLFLAADFIDDVKLIEIG